MRASPSIYIVMYLILNQLVHSTVSRLTKVTPAFTSLHHQFGLNTYQICRHHLSSFVSTIDDQQRIHNERSNDPKEEVEERISNLRTHPAVVWDTNSTFSSMHKKKLGRRHLMFFDRSHESNRDVLFDEFATAVCNAGVVARKEVFETWASALYIHDYIIYSQVFVSVCVRAQVAHAFLTCRCVLK